jgi:hypothetical protein
MIQNRIHGHTRLQYCSELVNVKVASNRKEGTMKVFRRVGGKIRPVSNRFGSDTPHPEFKRADDLLVRRAREQLMLHEALAELDLAPVEHQHPMRGRTMPTHQERWTLTPTAPAPVMLPAARRPRKAKAAPTTLAARPAWTRYAKQIRVIDDAIAIANRSRG